MLQLPFDISKSLSSYAELFEKNPEKATQRLEKQLQKRGPDAVGYFLLAWFYHLRNKRERAIEEALKARIFAPGSSFFHKLHYYLSHPDLFEAWTPDRSSLSRSPSPGMPGRRGPVLDLDALIQKLSKMETNRIRPDQRVTSQENFESTEITGDVDNIVSETLATIHEQQGKLDTAIRTYQKLKNIKADKSDYFDQQINRLRKIKATSAEEE